MGMGKPAQQIQPTHSRGIQTSTWTVQHEEVMTVGPSSGWRVWQGQTRVDETYRLALYNPQANTKINADASAYGLGAVLLQQHSDMHWKPGA